MAVVVDLVEVEVERMSLEEAEELRGLGEAGVAMGVGQVEEPCSVYRLLGVF